MNKIELFFYFKYKPSKRIKTNFKDDQKIGEVINSIISSNEYFKNITINLISCNDKPINEKETFKNYNIKNNDIITIICESRTKEEIEKSKNENFIQFKYELLVTDHAHVNLPNSNLSAIIDRTFDVFKSLKDEYVIVFAFSLDYHNYSLIMVDIEKKKVIAHKINAHSERVFTCIHYLDEYNNRDLLITGSFDKTIKIWNISDGFQLLYEKKPDYDFQENTYLLSECLLFNNNNLYLITSAYEMYSNGYEILYYDLYNNVQDFKYLNNSKDNTNYIETYYDDKKPLIIAANLGNVKIFDFNDKKLIKAFSENNPNENYLSAIIYKYNDMTSIITSSSDGYIRIWDFDDPSSLILKIKATNFHWVVGMELIDNRYLLVACYDGSFKEYDIKSEYNCLNFQRVANNDTLLSLRYINIKGNHYLFTHSKMGLIELWK